MPKFHGYQYISLKTTNANLMGALEEQGNSKRIRIHHLGTVMSVVESYVAVCPIAVEIGQSRPKCWTEQYSGPWSHAASVLTKKAFNKKLSMLHCHLSKVVILES